MDPRIQLLGIGNAIVDILAHVDEDFLVGLGIPRGSMTLIDEGRAREIYETMGVTTQVSGGSVANTIANFAELGGRAAYIGRVKADQFGEVFMHDMRSLGAELRIEPAASGLPTARSYIIITPDGQRTMQTYLGACTQLGVADISEQTVGDPAVLLLEGYVWDLPEGPALLDKAMDIAAAAGSRIALSLSDSFCVDRHREEFLEVVQERADVVLADADEAMALYRNWNFEDVARIAAETGKLFVMTRSEQGSVVVRGGERIDQPAERVEKVIDTTGAGDAYATGFLLGLSRGAPLAECARLGTHCATHVIQRVGARIDKDLLDPPG